MLIEILISVIFYPPNFSGIYTGTVNEYEFIILVNAIFSLLTILKIYHIFKMYRYFSKFSNFDSNSISKKYGVKENFLFSFKTELKFRPFYILTVTFILFLMLMSFSLRTFENGIFLNEKFLLENGYEVSQFRNIQLCDKLYYKGTQNLDFIANSMWFIIVTITTVGYGDAYPKTHFGRTVSSIACILGIFLISLITASLSKYIQFNSDENKAYLTLKQMQHEREVHIRAHEVIKTILQINKSNKVKKTSYKQDFQIKLNTNKSKKDNKIIEERKERINILINKFVLLAQLKKNITNFKLEDKT